MITFRHALLASAGCLVIAACSATSEPTGFTSSGATQGSGAGTPGGSPATGAGGEINLTSGVGGNINCPNSCSADLKNVIDCNGAVISTCGGDQGCANGACIADPCEAAKIGKSSYGCDYWALKTDLIAEGSGACFAAFVANTWSTPVHLQAEWNGQTLPASAIRIPVGQGQGLTYSPYDPVAGLPVGEVAILFLSRGAGSLPDCPVPAALAQDASVQRTGRGTAFHITSDRPVVAYQILPYGGGSSAATSATLLLPTSVWDTNYIAINAYQKSQLVADGDPSLDILAHEDGTQVTILPNAAILAGPGVDGTSANVPVTYSLNRGEYLQITQVAELTGSPIQSNKPIGVWGAASCLNVPTGAAACDSAQQQIPPVKALGNEYAGVRYRGRQGQEETPPWRLVGAVDGTQLTWTPGPPNGAPTTLNLGQVSEFNSSGYFVVKSQDADHPFYLAQYMTGGDQFLGEGDPEWVNVIPTAQYLDSYVLFTDPTYSETSLVVIRKPSKVDQSFADVTLDCAGPLTGWQELGPYQFTRIDLVTGNFQNVGNCSNGRHEIKSPLPFGVTVWGWGNIPGFGGPDLFTQYVSYAYPAGASVQSINEVVIPPVPN